MGACGGKSARIPAILRCWPAAAVLLALVAPLRGEPPQPTQLPTWPLPSSLHGQVTLEQADDGSSLRLHLNARMRGSAPRGVATVAMEVRRGQLILPGVVIFEPVAPDAEHAVDARLDTSAQGAVLLSGGAAVMYRPWISSEVPPDATCGPFGAIECRVGALGGLRLGAISIEPVSVRVGPIADSVVIGMEALTAFEGAIFDWDRRQMSLVVRRTLYSADDPPSRGAITSLAARREWTTVPLRMGVGTESYDELRHVMISTRPMWPRILVQVGWHTYTALIDTGYAGDVLLREGLEWPLEPVPDGMATSEAPDTQGQRPLGRLRVPLTVGQRLYDHVDVEGGWVPPTEMESLGIDAVIGVGVLQRSPIWLDFEAGAVRLWTGKNAFPGLGVGGT